MQLGCIRREQLKPGSWLQIIPATDVRGYSPGVAGTERVGGWGKNYYISTIPTSIKTLLTSIAIEIGPTITKINGWVHHETSKGGAAESPAVPPS